MKLFLFLCLTIVSINICFAEENSTFPLINIRVSHSFNKNSQHEKSIFKITQVLEKDFFNKVNFNITSLKYNEQEELMALDLGLIDMVFTSVENIEKYYKINDFDIFNLPFLFTEDKEMITFMNSELSRKMLFKLSEKSDFIYPITFWPDEVSVYVSKIKFDSIETFKNKNIDVKKNEISEVFIKEMGANPVVRNNDINNKDIKNFIKDEGLDITEETIDNIFIYKLYDNVKNIILTNHKRNNYILLANKKWLKSLPEKIREDLTSTSIRIATNNIELFQENKVNNLLTLKKKNIMNIYLPDSKEIVKLKSYSIPSHNNFLNINKNLIIETYKTLKKI